MTILLTGINGFLGRAIATNLTADGIVVAGLDVAPASSEAPWRVEPVDVRDRHALRSLIGDLGADTVIHAGGVSGPHVANEQPALVAEVNVLGTTNILEVARELGLDGRVVLLSSSSTYGEVAEQRSLDVPCPETQALLASEPYGASKVASEAIMRAYVEQGGVDAVALRVSIVYGAGRRTYCGITEMINEALNSGTIELHHGSDLPLPWIDVDDVVAAVRASLSAPPASLRNEGTHAYNVTGPGYPTFDEIAKTVADLTEGTTITHGDRPDAYAMNARKMSIAAAERDLGWVPEITIDAGVRTLIEDLNARRP